MYLQLWHVHVGLEHVIKHTTYRNSSTIAKEKYIPLKAERKMEILSINYN